MNDALINNELGIKVKKFIETKWFILILGILTFLCWILRIFLLSTVFGLIALIMILLFKAKFTSLLSVFFLMIAGRSKFKMGSITSIQNIIPLIMIIGLGIVLIVLIILDIMANYRKYYYHLKGNKILLSMILLGAYMTLTLVYTPKVGSGIVFILKTLVIFLFSILALLKVKNNKENKNLIMFSVIMMIFIIFGEFLVRIIYVSQNYEYLYTARSHINLVYVEYHDMEVALDCKELGLFWAVSNHYMILVNFGVIVSISYAVMNKNKMSFFYSLFAIILAMIMNYYCRCRAGYLALIIAVAFFVISAMIRNKTNNQKLIIYTIIGLIATICIIGAIIIVTPTKLMELFQEQGRNRNRVFKIAIEQFKNNYLFGTGAGSSGYYLKDNYYDGQALFNYHNYILQVLSTLGIVGMLFFGYHLYEIIKAIWNKSIYSIMMMAILVYILVNGLFDTIFFNWMYMVVFFVLIMINCNNYYEKEKYSLF